MSIDPDNILVGAGTLAVATVDVGGTEGGLSFSYEREYVDKEVDQSPLILGKEMFREVLNISTSLKEATLANIQTAFDIATLVGDSLSLGGGPGGNEKALVFVGKAPEGGVRTVTIYKAVSIDASEHSYLKDGATVIPVVFQAIADLTKVAGEQYGKMVDS